MLRPLPIDNIFCLQIFRCLQNCQIYEFKILLLYVRAWLMHRGLLRFFLSLDYSKNTTKEESQMSNFHTTLQKIVLYWCLGLIRHNIGTHLKLNKYIFDISIPLCHHLYLSATLKQCFTEFAVCRTTFHHVDMSVRGRIPTCDLIDRLFLGSGLKINTFFAILSEKISQIWKKNQLNSEMI